MKSILAVGLTVALGAQASTLNAEELVSGPQVGERVGSLNFEFSGIKCGGAKDGIKVGTNYSYY